MASYLIAVFFKYYNIFIEIQLLEIYPINSGLGAVFLIHQVITKPYYNCGSFGGKERTLWLSRKGGHNIKTRAGGEPQHHL